jgi:hypothetical protein
MNPFPLDWSSVARDLCTRMNLASVRPSWPRLDIFRNFHVEALFHHPMGPVLIHPKKRCQLSLSLKDLENSVDAYLFFLPSLEMRTRKHFFGINIDFE